jgi:hypothetical protein
VVPIDTVAGEPEDAPGRSSGAIERQRLFGFQLGLRQGFACGNVAEPGQGDVSGSEPRPCGGESGIEANGFLIVFNSGLYLCASGVGAEPVSCAIRTLAVDRWSVKTVDEVRTYWSSSTSNVVSPTAG